MKKSAPYDEREGHLRLFLGAGRQLLQVDDLHFGFWPDGLEVSLRNLPVAQEKHSEFIISHIPETTKTILDIGCGVGVMASRLVGLGYKVEGVSPSAFLAEETHKLLGDEFHIFECGIEDLETDHRYDLVLFSESFQYVKMEEALAKCLELLTENGHLMICDFFKREVEGDSPLNSGPPLSGFRKIVSELPLELIEDIDISSETAPTMDLANGILQNLFSPAWDLLLAGLKHRRPLLSRLLRWKFKKKIDKVEWRYFNGAQSGENFKKYKSYRLMLYRKMDR